jgi:8-oxo-dGTP pyrophosphatase MutT (NUDIX family)
VFRNDDHSLVFEGRDPTKPGVFYRPLGGIEPGEYGEKAIAREIREEIGAEIADVRYLGTLENIFTFDGRLGHEIVLVFDAAFVDKSFYARSEFCGIDDGNTLVKAVWKPLKYFEDRRAPLYPDGLVELLERNTLP